MAHAHPQSMFREAAEHRKLVHRHLQAGWCVLLVFLTMGLALEAFHGVKSPFYLNVSYETRRLMWTLAHAHGTLFGLINLAFAQTVSQVPARPGEGRPTTSLCLLGATLLMPVGFLMGGMFLRAGEPGLPVVLVPVGGFLLLVALFRVARGLSQPG